MRDLVVLAAISVFGGLVLVALWSQRGRAPGLVSGRLAPPGPRPNTVCSEPDTPADAAVPPLRANFADARAAVEMAGGTVVTETDSYIAATFATPLLRFVDDVELRDAGDGTVHVRSGSRVGYSDMGANRKRVAKIRSHLPDHPNSAAS